ncbi:MAG: hypothetical protein SAL07_05160 [Oscillatoria sp. PMC 1051.18]|nr:hypothetical protein [Oscillatoria sp. PMC 1050.18]MEC5029282.1 hypothetical protein [Oscillatoria sp. PMC 1051.18]
MKNLLTVSGKMLSKIVTGTALCVVGTLGTVSVSSAESILLAQRNYCPQGQEMYVAAETNGFFINICGSGGSAITYVGVSKSDGNSISLPISSAENGQFVADNGNVRYSLDGTKLVVTQGNRTLVSQYVTAWY